MSKSTFLHFMHQYGMPIAVLFVVFGVGVVVGKPFSDLRGQAVSVTCYFAKSDGQCGTMTLLGYCPSGSSNDPSQIPACGTSVNTAGASSAAIDLIHDVKPVLCDGGSGDLGLAPRIPGAHFATGNGVDWNDPAQVRGYWKAYLQASPANQKPPQGFADAFYPGTPSYLLNKDQIDAVANNPPSPCIGAASSKGDASSANSTPYSCATGGNAFCAGRGLCIDISDPPYIKCVGDASSAMSTPGSCAEGGDTYCRGIGKVCVNIPDLPYIKCVSNASSAMSAPTIMPSSWIVDDSDPQFAVLPAQTNAHQDAHAYKGSDTESLGGNYTHADWEFSGPTAGSHDIFVTWSSANSDTTDTHVPYSVIQINQDGSQTVLGMYAVDQSKPPSSDRVIDGVPFQKLATIQFSGVVLLVEVSGIPANTSPPKHYDFDAVMVAFPPAIGMLSPPSGQAGSAVTIHGTGFDGSNNTVFFGTDEIDHLPSIDGATITFTVPNEGPGTYNVSVQVGSNVTKKLIYTITKPPESSSAEQSSTAANCADGGDAFCAQQGKYCVDIPDLPYIKCVSNASSAPRSASSSVEPQKSGNLTISMSPVPAQDILAGTATARDARYALQAQSENANIQEMDFSVTNYMSVDHLILKDAADGSVLGTATPAGCGPNWRPGMFCAVFTGNKPTVSISAIRNIDVYVAVHNDESDVMHGNIGATLTDVSFIGAESGYAAHATLQGSMAGMQDPLVFAAIAGITDAGQASGQISPGTVTIGNWKLTAAQNTNTMNGLNKVKLQTVDFTVQTNNLTIDAGSAFVFTSADYATHVPAQLLDSNGMILSGNVSGTFRVTATFPEKSAAGDIPSGGSIALFLGDGGGRLMDTSRNGTIQTAFDSQHTSWTDPDAVPGDTTVFTGFNVSPASISSTLLTMQGKEQPPSNWFQNLIPWLRPSIAP
ncbi:MAG TPA: IPT/TIG domain-containing protein [Candidatus Peribacteraceae bacterium]|nr:IPT/TIG domain-containing protein [Candidatus Peribacteraceae bacterium]